MNGSLRDLISTIERRRSDAQAAMEALDRERDAARALRIRPRRDTRRPAESRPAISGHGGGRSPSDEQVWEWHVRYARTRDRSIRDRLVAHYEPLVRGLARRYYRHREGLDDLLQVAYEGLLLALQRFDPERQLPFPSFATPTIAGLLKRHFRDNGWALRVPRRVHEIHRPLREASEHLTHVLGRPPLLEELARELGVDGDTVLEALAATDARATASLDAPSRSGRGDGGRQVGYDDARLVHVENRQALVQTLPLLSDSDRDLLQMYFGDEMTQSEIASRLGVSQMQVSRLLASALGRLRSRLPAD